MARLTNKAPYGRHVSLYCVNHPDLRWSTKNIAPLGCRHIFYNLMGETDKPECNCSLDDLRVVEIDGPFIED